MMIKLEIQIGLLDRFNSIPMSPEWNKVFYSLYILNTEMYDKKVF